MRTVDLSPAAGRRRVTIVAGILAAIASACTIAGLLARDEMSVGPLPAPPIAVDELSTATLYGLISSPAGTPVGARTCASDAVEARLTGFDAALGHRFTTLRVRNVDEETCELDGTPGLGARGHAGSAFLLEVEPVLTLSSRPVPTPVVLAPGQEAAASIEWTGVLAGALDEKAATLVVQLAEAQVPILVQARLDGAAVDTSPLDVGAETTLRVGPFEPAKVVPR